LATSWRSRCSSGSPRILSLGSSLVMGKEGYLP
jgi:hypothetical protein